MSYRRLDSFSVQGNRSSDTSLSIGWANIWWRIFWVQQCVCLFMSAIFPFFCSCLLRMFCENSVQEFMDFTSKILVEKTDEGQRTSVGEKGSLSVQLFLHCVSKINIPDVFSYNPRKRWRIFIIFGRNVTEKASNHMLLYFSTSPN